MGDFKPSVEAARIALGSGTTIEHRAHPAGVKGARVSLEEVAKRIRDGRQDARIRALAGEIIIAAGRPISIHDKVQALLDGLRSRTVYEQDPTDTEFMAAAKNTLCLDDNGLCIKVGDCDDLSVAMGSLLMSIDIPTKVVGQSFDTIHSPTHVLVAAKTERGWEKVDPSSRKHNVGESFKATEEWWFDPMDAATLKLAGVNPHGDFIGVGRIPSGLGLTPNEKVAFDASVINYVEQTVFELEKALNFLHSAVQQIEQTRQIIRPEAPFDPEPVSPIKDIADFPLGTGLWTKSMSNVSAKLWATGDWMVRTAKEALAGSRQLLVDRDNIFIEARESDRWKLHVIFEGAAEKVVGVFNRVGELVGGFTSKGRDLTESELASLKQRLSGKQSGAVGGPLIVIGVVAVAAAVIAIAGYYIIKELSERATTAAEQAIYKTELDMIRDGKITVEEQQRMQKARAAAAAAAADAKAKNAAADPLSRSLQSLGTIFTWLAVGGVVVAGAVVAAPYIQESLARTRTRRAI